MHRTNRDEASLQQLEAAAGLSLTQVQQALVTRYGEVLSTTDAAAALKLSVGAFREARSRGTVKLEPLEISGRREKVFASVDVAMVLLSWLSKRPQSASPEVQTSPAQPEPNP